MKFKVGDTAYQCRNSSYVFKTKPEIEKAIDTVEIERVERSYKGKTQYLVIITSKKEKGFEHTQDEEELYNSKQALVDTLVAQNIAFIEHLMDSAKNDFKEGQKALARNQDIYERRVAEYTELLEVMRNG